MKDPSKSQVSIMLGLIKSLCEDIVILHQLPPREAERDFDYIQRRTLAETASFLTKTLPLLGKAVDSGLLTGQFLCPSSYKLRGGTRLPHFMRRVFELVFDRNGMVLEEADEGAIASLRQICFLFYKYQLPYDESLVEEKISEFVEIDQQLPRCFSVDQMATVYYATEVVNEILKDFKFTLASPKNGPGAVANRIETWERYRPSHLYEMLDNTYPYDRIFYYNDRHLFDGFEEYRELDISNYGIAKLLAVPKDSRGPRLISAEPSEFMTYQQALKNELVPYLEHECKYTKYRINFSDQTVNGKLALEASKDGSHATIDLSAASDRLSLALVDLLFEETSVHDYLLNTRTSYTQLPIGKCVKLQKYAPMGSALCFPIEALSFYAICVGRLVSLGVPLSQASRQVYVYGDDIILPSQYATTCIDALESVALKVNVDKSCLTGKFRESCGVDAYNGVDVTPIKLKKLWPCISKRLHDWPADSLSSWIAACNNLHSKGYWRIADKIRKNLPVLPLVSIDSPLIGLTSTKADVLKANVKRAFWNEDLQCNCYKGFSLYSKAKVKIDGWQAMLKDAWDKAAKPQLTHLEEQATSSLRRFTARYSVMLKNTVVTESEI